MRKRKEEQFKDVYFRELLTEKEQEEVDRRKR